jgi:hypothetical protein
MACLRFPGHHGVRFTVERSDPVLVVLANVAVFGSLLWLVSRGSLLLRLGFMGILLAFRLSAPAPGWVAWLDSHAPLPWTFQLRYLQWLLIALPGTIVGDMLLRWGRTARGDANGSPAWSVLRAVGVVALMASLIITMLVCLHGRWLWQALAIAIGLCLLGWRAVAGAGTQTEKLVKNLLAWGAYCLILGLVFEPYEGGIRRSPDTLSYYFVTAGLAIFAFIAFFVVIEICGQRQRLQLLIDNGQNPMIAYVGQRSLVLPLFGLSQLLRVVDAVVGWVPWLGVLSALSYTLVLAYTVRVFTRAKVFWRT